MPAWTRALMVGCGPLVLHLVIPLADMAWVAAAAPGAPAAPMPGGAATPLRRAAPGDSSNGSASLNQASPAALRVCAPGPDSFWARVLPAASALAHMAAVAVALALVSAACRTLPAAAAAVAAAPSAATATAAAARGLLPLLALTLASSGAVAFGAIHELIHSRHPAHVAVARAFLALFWWSPALAVHHWHHKVMCTPADHTCAPRGMTAFAFIPRYVVGSYAKAWSLAAEACRRTRKPVLSWHNSVLVAWAAQLLSLAAIGAALGPAAAAFHAAVCAGMIAYIGALDFTFHYGLVRPSSAQLAAAAAAAAAAPAAAAEAGAGVAAAAAAAAAAPPPGFAPVTRFNSWSSPYPLENAMTYHGLQHSEHHIAAGTSHAWLRPTSGHNPHLPAPLFLAALAGFMPPLWRALMDGRADAVNAQNMEYLLAAAAGQAAAGSDASAAGGAGPAVAGAIAAASSSSPLCEASEAAPAGAADAAAAGAYEQGSSAAPVRATAWALQPAA
ncbi:hypothetical protein HXX76_001991 [Chlamydomonas incerta]|nr:hypothetical protein HXX76_001991 [Chlamydomonas incerta]|eukprot:KAG2443642.1 hypothetical protein HXX76_001991 [Chlamydomonas incerta]